MTFFAGDGMLRNKNIDMLISYITLRRLIGILGILLPFVCVVGGLCCGRSGIGSSISFYYFTNMRDFFVGLLAAIGLFLITYKGYERIDNIVTTVSGLAAFCVAAFPCIVDKSSTASLGIFQLPPNISECIHYAAAAVFFILLALNSIFLFTLYKGAKRISRRRIVRNRIYRASGVIILSALAVTGVLGIVLDPALKDRYVLVLILETIMLIAFGISWLVKGETLFRDRSNRNSVRTMRLYARARMFRRRPLRVL